MVPGFLVCFGHGFMQLNQATIADLMRRMEQGRFSEVIAETARLIAQFPRVAGLHEIHGMACARAGNVVAAEKALRRAIKLMPKLASARFNLGILFIRQQKWRQAADCLQDLLRLQPGNTHARCQLGIALFRQQKLDPAKACFERVVAETPETVEAHFHLGMMARQRDETAAALAHFSDVLAHRKDHFETLFNMGNIHRDLMNGDQARAYFEEALEARPQHVDTMINLANVEMLRHDLPAASRWLDRVRDIDPSNANAAINQANVEMQRLDMPAAIAWLDRALEIEPENVDAAFSRSLPYFLMDDLKAGFAAAELRFEKTDPVKMLYHGREPAWDGRRLGADDLLVIHAEQGLGDSLMMIRFLVSVDLSPDQVVVLVPAALVTLLASSFEGWLFEPLETHFKGWRGATLRCSFMSLPHVLVNRWAVPPASNGYLMASEHVIQKWHAVLGESSGPRIGLVWRGSPTHRSDHLRSIGLDELLAALPPGPDYRVLQKDVTDVERHHLAARPDLHISIEQLEDFADTAGLAMHLDELVSVDTSVVHLCGALGVKTSALVQHLPDWRWGLGRDTTLWYDSVKLIRQPRANDWSAPLNAITRRIEALLK